MQIIKIIFIKNDTWLKHHLLFSKPEKKNNIFLKQNRNFLLTLRKSLFELQRGEKKGFPTVRTIPASSQ
jgi:hypothetical protein